MQRASCALGRRLQGPRDGSSAARAQGRHHYGRSHRGQRAQREGAPPSAWTATVVGILCFAAPRSAPLRAPWQLAAALAVATAAAAAAAAATSAVSAVRNRPPGARVVGTRSASLRVSSHPIAFVQHSGLAKNGGRDARGVRAAVNPQGNASAFLDECCSESLGSSVASVASEPRDMASSFADLVLLPHRGRRARGLPHNSTQNASYISPAPHDRLPHLPPPASLTRRPKLASTALCTTPY